MAKKFLLFLLGFLCFINICLNAYYYYQRYQKQSFFCPVPQKYCKDARKIEINGKFFGIGYKVPEKTPIYAVSNGFLDKGYFSLNPKYGGGNYPVLMLTTISNENIEYIFTGREIKKGTEALKKEQIGLAGKENFANYDINLVIRMVKSSGEVADPREAMK